MIHPSHGPDHLLQSIKSILVSNQPRMILDGALDHFNFFYNTNVIYSSWSGPVHITYLAVKVGSNQQRRRTTLYPHYAELLSIIFNGNSTAAAV